jgi:hypothetical protein
MRGRTASCTQNHVLRAFRTPHDHFSCDGTRCVNHALVISAGSTMHGCRVWDYDPCDTCIGLHQTSQAAPPVSCDQPGSDSPRDATGNPSTADAPSEESEEEPRGFDFAALLELQKVIPGLLGSGEADLVIGVIHQHLHSLVGRDLQNGRKFGQRRHHQQRQP